MTRLFPLVLAVACLGVGASVLHSQGRPVAPEIAGQLPENAQVLDVKTRVVDGEEYTFVKFADAQGEVKGQTFDKNRRKIPEQRVPKPPKKVVDKALRKKIDELTDRSTKIKVEVALKVEHEEETELEMGSVEVGPPDSAGKPSLDLTLNGRAATAQEVAQAGRERAERARGRREEKMQEVRARLNQLAERHGWSEHPAIANAFDKDLPTVTIDLDAAEIEEVATRSGDLVAGIQPWVESYNMDPPPPPPVQPGMQRTNIDPYALNYSARKGSGVGIYMSETGCPNAGFISNYKKLSGTADSHNQNVAGILRTVSPSSYVYCRGNYSRPTSTDLNGYDGNPKIHIASNSFGHGESGDYCVHARDWDNLSYSSKVAVFFAAGNTGKPCNSSGWPVNAYASGLNILAVGAYDDSNNTIAGFSCYGDPDMGADKPEFSAPGVNIFAGGVSMSGTSQATPHAAAFGADLAGVFTWLKFRPYSLKAKMIASASDVISGGYDKVGVGGIDFYNAYYNGHNWWWSGGNSCCFSSNVIEVSKSLTAGVSYRVAIAWLNRGSWTYDHRNDSHPIGMDLDLSVISPSGSTVASSSSYDNPFEVVNFTPSVSGTYKFKIRRYANRDQSSGVYLGLTVEWW